LFYEKYTDENQRSCIRVSGLSRYSLDDTLECGQCFRHELIKREGGYSEYLIPVGEKIITVGQRTAGELIFYGVDEGDFDEVCDYFNLNTDLDEIREDIISRTDSAWLRRAAESAGGIAILHQDRWETLFSFIISQNNNIPRIRGIIRRLSREYGENLCEKSGIKACPLGRISATPCNKNCGECGVCYSFPRAEDVAREPERMQCARVGFRYKYLLDAAERVASGETDLDKIAAARAYEYTKGELMKIYGVGEKVAACVALFGFGNLEAFPIDVWMRRAIDTYFDGKLDPETLGRYSGVAQQYIFHYIRNLGD